MTALVLGKTSVLKSLKPGAKTLKPDPKTRCGAVLMPVLIYGAVLLTSARMTMLHELL